MKLERVHEYIIPAMVMLVGIAAAVAAGYLSGEGQIGNIIALLGAAVGVGLLLTLRQQIWIMIPITWTLAGQIPLLPLPFAVRDLIVMAVFVSFMVLTAFKVVRRKPTYGLIDILMGSIIAYLIIAFIRNPVGVEAFDSDRVGGRPYFNVFIACLAYWVISRSLVPEGFAKWLPLAAFGGRSIEGILNTITYHFPSTVPILALFYSNISSETYAAQDILRRPEGESTGRQAYLLYVGHPMVVTLISYFRPLTLINPLYLGRCLLFGTAMIFVLLSGFRSTLIAAGGYFLVASYIRRGWTEIAHIMAIGLPSLLLIIMMQGVVFDLPQSAQRTLSFLPGRWDEIAVIEAKGSTQWRVDMWKTVLTSDKYIQNKWFGDGFGFSRRELQVIKSLTSHGGTFEDTQENSMVTGAYHSGPVSAIRYVGYVGLVMFVLLQIMIAREAFRIVKRALGTPYEYFAFFVCVPAIFEPFYYVFIFGGYENALPDAIVSIALLKAIAGSLDASAKTLSQTRIISPPAPVKARRTPERAGARALLTHSRTRQTTGSPRRGRATG